MSTAADFEHAVETARQNTPIQKQIRREEAWVGYTIVGKSDGSLAVYQDDAWDPPTQRPLLPWSPPTGVPIARVDLDGNVWPIPPG